MILLKNFEKKAWSRKCTTLPTLKNRTSCPTLWRPLDDQGCRIVIRDPINSELKKASLTPFINFYQCWMKLRMILEWHASGHYPRICRQRRCIQYRRFCRIPVRSNGCRSQSRKQPAPGLCLPRNCRQRPAGICRTSDSSGYFSFLSEVEGRHRLRHLPALHLQGCISGFQ